MKSKPIGGFTQKYWVQDESSPTRCWVSSVCINHESVSVFICVHLWLIECRTRSIRSLPLLRSGKTLPQDDNKKTYSFGAI